MKRSLYLLDLAELSTVLAALRYYQANGQCEPGNRSDEIDEIATCGDEVKSLDEYDIDALCERLNCDGVKVDQSAPKMLAELAALIAEGDDDEVVVEDEDPKESEPKAFNVYISGRLVGRYDDEEEA